MIPKLEAQQDTHIQSRAARRGMSISRLVRRSLFYLLITVGAISMLLPFAYMVGIAFTPNAYVLQTPPTFIPVQPTFDNFIAAWNANNFGQAFFNSVIVACSSTFICVLLASMLAFAFARYQFPGRNILFYGM